MSWIYWLILWCGLSIVVAAGYSILRRHGEDVEDDDFF